MGQRNWVKRSFPTFLRWTKRGALIAVVVLIVLLILDTALTVVLQRRVESKIAEIRSAGGAMTFSELVGEPLSDQENAMIHYLYALSIMGPVLAEYDGLGHEILTAFHTLPRRSMMSERERPRAKDQKLQPDAQGPGLDGLFRPGIQRDGGRRMPRVGQEYERGVEAAREYLEKVQPDVEADGREIELAARHIFKRMEPGLQVVKDARELKSARMLSDYDIDASVRAGLVLPYLAKVRALARWVDGAAVLEARYGDTGQAVDLVCAGLHLANSLGHEPMLTVQLVRVAIGGTAFDAMQEVLDLAYPPEDHVEQILAEINALRERKCFIRAWQGSRCSATDPRYSPYGVIRTTGSAAALLGRPIRLLDVLEYLETIDEVIDLTALPTYKSRQSLSDLEERFPPCVPVGRRLTFRPFRSSFSCASPARVSQALDRLVVLCDIAEMAIYLKQFKKKTGSYPQKLDGIMPEYIQELPVDPFTGGPYVYRKESEGFVLYSVSVNLVDDDGKPDWREGDIVWRSSR